MPSLPLFTAATTLQRLPLSHVRFPGLLTDSSPPFTNNNLEKCSQRDWELGIRDCRLFPKDAQHMGWRRRELPIPMSPQAVPQNQLLRDASSPPAVADSPGPSGKSSPEWGGRGWREAGGGPGGGSPCPAPCAPRALLTMRLQPQRAGRDQAGLQLPARIPTAATTGAKTKLGVQGKREENAWLGIF